MSTQDIEAKLATLEVEPKLEALTLNCEPSAAVPTSSESNAAIENVISTIIPTPGGVGAIDGKKITTETDGKTTTTETITTTDGKVMEV